RQVGTGGARVEFEIARPKTRLQNRRSRSPRARRRQRSQRRSKSLSHARSDGQRTRPETLRSNAGQGRLEMKKKRASAKEVYALVDLKNWHDVKPPIRLGVFGDPVEHSLSPQMQNAALKESKIDMQYARFRISPNELREGFDLIRKLEFVGLNLTIPHKIAALELLDSADDNVKRIGAVNVIKAESGKLGGFNTDGRGFARAIREEFSVALRDMRVLVVGAGGAARAIALQCAKENCERLVIANGTFEKGQKLADSLRDFFSGPKVFGPVPRLQAIPWEERAFQFQI